MTAPEILCNTMHGVHGCYSTPTWMLALGAMAVVLAILTLLMHLCPRRDPSMNQRNERANSEEQ